MDIDVTQDSTGALVEGITVGPCTGEVQTWDAVAVVRRSGGLLEPGPAQACAVATTRKGWQITDAFTWCKPVTLIE